MGIRLTIFACILLVSVYLLSSATARKFKKVNPKKALLYVASVAMIGVLGEITADASYKYYFHTALWRYNYLPIHHAFTSQFSPMLWGVFGFYLYLNHHSLEKWTRRQLVNLALIFAVEALVVEAFADLISKAVLGNYIYYYYPNGLWHITSFQGFPFYIICGFVVAETIHRFKADPHFFTFISTWVVIVTIL
jgi:hypothetical protein